MPRPNHPPTHRASLLRLAPFLAPLLPRQDPLLHSLAAMLPPGYVRTTRVELVHNSTAEETLARAPNVINTGQHDTSLVWNVSMMGLSLPMPVVVAGAWGMRAAALGARVCGPCQQQGARQL